jgi:hypothetical protein
MYDATLCQMYELCLRPTASPRHPTYIKKQSACRFTLGRWVRQKWGGGTTRMLMANIILIVVHGTQRRESEQYAVD